jgi:hypothetical protein
MYENNNTSIIEEEIWTAELVNKLFKEKNKMDTNTPIY